MIMEKVCKATMNFTSKEETMRDTIMNIATDCKATRIEIDCDTLRFTENGLRCVWRVEFYFATFTTYYTFIEKVQDYFEERKY